MEIEIMRMVWQINNNLAQAIIAVLCSMEKNVIFSGNIYINLAENFEE